MKYKKKIVFIVATSIIIMVFLLLAALEIQRRSRISNARSYFLSNPQAFEIEAFAEIVNKTDKSLKNLYIHIPIPENEFPYQYVEIISIDPAPLKILRDKNCNSKAVFYLSRLNPSEKFLIKLRFKVQVFRIVYDINWKNCIGAKEEFKEFKQPEKHMEISDPKFKSGTERILNGEVNPYFSALRFYDYLCKEIYFDYKFKPVGALLSLIRQQAACCDAAYLFTALCRAADIPARYVGGLYLGNLNFERQKENWIRDTHAWSLFYIPYYGWLPVDPTLGRYNEVSRYYCFAEQRNQYVLLWKDERDPFVIKVSGIREDEIEAKLNPSFKVKIKAIPNFLNFSYKNSCPVKWGDKKIEFGNKKPKLRVEHVTAEKLENYLKLQEYEKYLTSVEDILKINPEYFEVYHSQLRSIFIENKYKNKDIFYNFLSRKIKQNPQDELVRYGLGIYYITGEEYSKAINEFEKCIKSGINNSQIFNTLGYIYLKTKQISLAENSFILAIQKDPVNDLAYNNLINLYQNLGEHEAMINWSKSAIDKFPQDSKFYALASAGYLGLKDYKNALFYINKAIKLDSAIGEYYAVRGMVYLEKNLEKQAIFELQKGIKLGIGSENSNYYKKVLESLGVN